MCALTKFKIHHDIIFALLKLRCQNIHNKTNIHSILKKEENQFFNNFVSKCLLNMYNSNVVLESFNIFEIWNSRNVLFDRITRMKINIVIPLSISMHFKNMEWTHILSKALIILCHYWQRECFYGKRRFCYQNLQSTRMSHFTASRILISFKYAAKFLG